MQLRKVTLKNFRCYAEEISIEIGDLTTLVGKNDIGKSTVLEALEIFFNNDVVAIESGDANITTDTAKVEITCEFSDLPSDLTLDAGAKTCLADEYLVVGPDTLKIRKVFDCGIKKPSCEVFVIAQHPTANGFANLLELKEKDLQAKVRDLGLKVALKGNPGMRKAIWEAAPDLMLAEIAIYVAPFNEASGLLASRGIDDKRLAEPLAALPGFARAIFDYIARRNVGCAMNGKKGGRNSFRNA